MTYRYSSTVDIKTLPLSAGQLKFFVNRKSLRTESFIDFEQAVIVQLRTRHLQQLPNSIGRSDAHDRRVYSHAEVLADGSQRL